MKFKDIKKGKTYYQPTQSYTSSNKLKAQIGYIKYFVLEVNEDKSQVLASANGAAPAWYGNIKIAKWEESKPENAGEIVSYFRQRNPRTKTIE